MQLAINYSHPAVRLVEEGKIQDDWKWLEWVLQRIRTGEWNRPWLLAVEYGGIGEPLEWRSDSQVMTEQVPRLSEMLIR